MQAAAEVSASKQAAQKLARRLSSLHKERKELNAGAMAGAIYMMNPYLDATSLCSPLYSRKQDTPAMAHMNTFMCP